MKKFDNRDYLIDIRKKIPGYDLMQEIVFKSILPVELKGRKIEHILAIGSQADEIKSLIRLYPEAKITVIDPSIDMIELARENCSERELRRIDFICGKFEEVDLKNKSQLCICMMVLQFVEDMNLFLNKVYSSLESSGILILSVFTTKDLEYWKEFALSRGADSTGVEKTYRAKSELMKAINAEEVETALLSNGFNDYKRVCEILSSCLWLSKKQ